MFLGSIATEKVLGALTINARSWWEAPLQNGKSLEHSAACSVPDQVLGTMVAGPDDDTLTHKLNFATSMCSRTPSQEKAAKPQPIWRTSECKCGYQHCCAPLGHKVSNGRRGCEGLGLPCVPIQQLQPAQQLLLSGTSQKPLSTAQAT